MVIRKTNKIRRYIPAVCSPLKYKATQTSSRSNDNTQLNILFVLPAAE